MSNFINYQTEATTKVFAFQINQSMNFSVNLITRHYRGFRDSIKMWRYKAKEYFLDDPLKAAHYFVVTPHEQPYGCKAGLRRRDTGPSWRWQCQQTYSWKLRVLNHPVVIVVLPHGYLASWTPEPSIDYRPRAEVRGAGSPWEPAAATILQVIRSSARCWGEGCLLNPGQMVPAFSRHPLRV